MEAYVCKINWSNDQCRITIPKELVITAGLRLADYMVLVHGKKNIITMRRFIDAEEDTKKSGRHRAA